MIFVSTLRECPEPQKTDRAPIKQDFEEVKNLANQHGLRCSECKCLFFPTPPLSMLFWILTCLRFLFCCSGLSFSSPPRRSLDSGHLCDSMKCTPNVLQRYLLRVWLLTSIRQQASLLTATIPQSHQQTLNTIIPRVNLSDRPIKSDSPWTSFIINNLRSLLTL